MCFIGYRYTAIAKMTIWQQSNTSADEEDDVEMIVNEDIVDEPSTSPYSITHKLSPTPPFVAPNLVTRQPLPPFIDYIHTPNTNAIITSTSTNKIIVAINPQRPRAPASIQTNIGQTTAPVTPTTVIKRPLSAPVCRPNPFSQPTWPITNTANIILPVTSSIPIQNTGTTNIPVQSMGKSADFVKVIRPATAVTRSTGIFMSVCYFLEVCVLIYRGLCANL